MSRPASPRTIKRLVRRLEAADAVCSELVTQLSARVVEADWSRLPDLLVKWIEVTPAHIRYSSSTPNPGREAEDEPLMTTSEKQSRSGSPIASSPLLDALSSRIQTIADEAFGPFPMQSAADNLTEIERGIAKQREEIEALRDELTRLSDVVCDEDRASILRFLPASNHGADGRSGKAVS